jgi:hypothetical protein
MLKEVLREWMSKRKEKMRLTGDPFFGSRAGLPKPTGDPPAASVMFRQRNQFIFKT